MIRSLLNSTRLPLGSSIFLRRLQMSSRTVPLSPGGSLRVKLREWKLKLMVQDHNLWDRATIECHGPENGGQSEHIKPEEPILFADEKANSVRLEQPASQLSDVEVVLKIPGKINLDLEGGSGMSLNDKFEGEEHKIAVTGGVASVGKLRGMRIVIQACEGHIVARELLGSLVVNTRKSELDIKLLQGQMNTLFLDESTLEIGAGYNERMEVFATKSCLSFDHLRGSTSVMSRGGSVKIGSCDGSLHVDSNENIDVTLSTFDRVDIHSESDVRIGMPDNPDADLHCFSPSVIVDEAINQFVRTYSSRDEISYGKAGERYRPERLGLGQGSERL
uniref:Adhesin domain-containing protein n=3 Tax=Rhodosorus marinus TaxID=101924 RepID=A0A7S2ZM89_9RHOD|mmetsp:Transcript_24706/g.97593  ORF Transcript_24706/g.97593 Transcript_24706/m.97593 type:complete len:333 (+) Transcript_24706:204-1202(+)